MELSVGRVRKNVNTTRCISNLRDISAALFAYSAEHNESVMPKVSKPNVQWHAVIDKYLGGRRPDINSVSVTSKSWACPQNKKHRCYSADKKHLKTSKLLSKFIVMNLGGDKFWFAEGLSCNNRDQEKTYRRRI